MVENLIMFGFVACLIVSLIYWVLILVYLVKNWKEIFGKDSEFDDER